MLCDSFINIVHSGIGVSHLGRSRTEKAISQRAYWVGWTADVRRVLSACEKCVRYKRGKIPRRTPLRPIGCGEPWELVSIDITGPHPTSRDGYSWILTLQDHFSKWVEAIPIRRHTAPIVARALYEEVFTKFGAPMRLLSDQGPEFESELFSELCRLLQIDKLRTSPYCPTSNGQLERFHRCLNSLLAKVVAINQKDWPDHLQTVVAAYRATVHDSTGFTPNRVFLGRDVRLPIDLALGITPDSSNSGETMSEYVSRLQERMQTEGEVVREHLGRAALKMKTRYDARIKTSFSFKVGDRVWYFYPRRYTKISPKWQSLFTGPYTVVKILDPCNVAIQRVPRARVMVVHRDKLRPVAGTSQLEEPPQPPAKVKRGVRRSPVSVRASDGAGELPVILPNGTGASDVSGKNDTGGRTDTGDKNGTGDKIDTGDNLSLADWSHVNSRPKRVICRPKHLRNFVARVYCGRRVSKQDGLDGLVAGVGAAVATLPYPITTHTAAGSTASVAASPTAVLCPVGPFPCSSAPAVQTISRC